MLMAGSGITSLEAGYKAYPSSTRDKNKGAWDQPFLALNHLGIADWGDYYGHIKVENPGRWSENQSGKDGVSTIKGLGIVQYELAGSALHLWGQNFITGNSNLAEDNLYLGVSHTLNRAGVILNGGLGINYSYASFSPTDQDFDGLSGYAAVVNVRYPFVVMGVKNILQVYYEGQFDRARQHQRVFDYRGYGHQLITSLKVNLTDMLYARLYLTQFDSWASTPNDGIEYGASGGISF